MNWFKRIFKKINRQTYPFIDAFYYLFIVLFIVLLFVISTFSDVHFLNEAIKC